MRAELTVGVVAPRTGRLAKLGAPLLFAGELFRERAPRVAGRRLRLAVRDSRSDPRAAKAAAADLAREADVVVAMGGTRVLPALSDTCEQLGVPCLTTTFPWQVWHRGRGGSPERPFRWTHHFCWGLDDIAAVFADMWDEVAPAARVGCLWNDDLQGAWLRKEFPAALADRPHELVLAAPYAEPAADLAPQIAEFRAAGVDVVTAAGTGEDLDLFRAQAARLGLRPRLITSSRWLTYPRATPVPGVATLVYWSPQHPYRSSVDGMSAAELAAAFERSTGQQWLQPLGLAHALFEVAAEALGTAADPEDPGSVADALARAKLDTVAGTLDWTGGPAPNVATVPLAGGQWRSDGDGRCELRVVTNRRCPDVLPEAALLLR